MLFTPLGTVGRPHGLKGAFVLSGYDGDGGLFSAPLTFSLENERGQLSRHKVERALCLNGRWVLHLTEINSIERAEQLRGATVLCSTAELVECSESSGNEYPLASLTGAEVRDLNSDRKIGTFLGIEETGPVSADAQRWWIRGDAIDFAVPNHESYLAKIDTTANIIWLQNWEELEALAHPEKKP